jgi:hypothetical protein
MWSKIPKPGAKGLRCQVLVKRDGEMVICMRPAKRYEFIRPPVAHWIEPIQPPTETICACVAHHRKMVNEGADLTLTSKRKVIA